MYLFFGIYLLSMNDSVKNLPRNVSLEQMEGLFWISSVLVSHFQNVNTQTKKSHHETIYKISKDKDHETCLRSKSTFWINFTHSVKLISKLYISSTIIFASCMTMELLAELQSSFRKEDDDYHH